MVMVMVMVGQSPVGVMVSGAGSGPAVQHPGSRLDAALQPRAEVMGDEACRGLLGQGCDRTGERDATGQAVAQHDLLMARTSKTKVMIFI
ncbi:hypothetical protein GCM10011504_20140 [Siccirubricoccus deserti]|nr:hypothetical protein GCM10011504_20140 [Siccirubricoccus deserti]